MSIPAKKPQSSSANRVARYRQRMREAGLVPKTIWVHDSKSPEYLAEARRQSLAVAAHDPAGDEIMDWIDQAYDLGNV